MYIKYIFIEWQVLWSSNGLKYAVLKRLLARKFGPLPEGVEQRLKAATPAQLETWSLNILDAATMEDVFRE